MKNKRGGARKNPYPDQATVRQTFQYVLVPTHLGLPDSAALLWLKSRGTANKGDPAGCKAYTRAHKLPDRYLVKLNGHLYNIKDLIWIYHNGAIPPGGVKVANGDRFDLRIENIVPRKPVVSFM